MKHILAASALALAAGPALAGNLTPPAPEPVIAAPAPAPVGHDWTGGYVGAQLGYGNLDTSGAADVSGDGAIGGVHAGYDYDFGQWVLGGEVEFDAADISLSGGAGKLNSVARLKLRGGYDLGQTLIYGTGGAAYADASLGGNGANDTGYFVGLGAEHMLNDNWSVGGEVLYHRFDNFDGSGIDINATTAEARVSLRF